MEHCEVLHECGFIKPINCISMDDRCSMVQVLTLQFVVLHCKAELDQFIEGVKVLGVLHAIREHHSLLRPFFCRNFKQLTAGIHIICSIGVTQVMTWHNITGLYLNSVLCITVDIRKLLTVQFSAKGTSAREREEATYMHFLAYLQNCEKSKPILVCS